jgi:uncharacterized membrane protein
MLIAILGIAGTLVGAIAGAAITGFISYRNTNLQINARKTELKEQLEHQQREARRSLRAEDRKRYLVPLRETTSRWAAELTRMIEQTDNIGRAIERSEKYPFVFKRDSIEPQKKVLEEIQGRMSSLKQNVEALCGQVYNEELSLDIDMVLLKESEVRNNSFPVLHSEIEKQLASHKKGIIQSLGDSLQKNRKASLELREELQKVNKRIEELLIGDETA